MLAAVAAVMVLGGCGTYTIKGKVLRSGFSDAGFVDADDSSLGGTPLAGVNIALIRDPDKLSKETIGTATSGPDGTFSLPVSSFGAGWLEERWAVRATRGGFQDVEANVALPGSPSGRVLLIQLQQGPSGGMRNEQERIMDEYEQFR